MTQSRACPHPDGPAGAESVCDHLVRAKAGWVNCYRWFLGRGMDSELLCAHCTEVREQSGLVITKPICEKCFDLILDEIADPVGFRGSPEIKQRRIPLTVDPVRLFTINYDLVDLAPVQGFLHQWLGLDAKGCVVSVDIANSVVRELVEISPIAEPEPDHKPWNGRRLTHRLHASGDGKYIAVVNDYGQRGLVIEVASSRITMALDGGDYHPNTVPFSVCFVTHDRSVLVHRTAWNRLDASDPATGELLTDRMLPELRGEKCPPHYLDYFHGRLYPSPDGKRVLDDGWLWHPLGIPAIWSVQAWLSGNVWESEDGPTRRQLCHRDYWDHGMCWLDNEHVAIGGLGDSDLMMPPGARIFARAQESDWNEVSTFTGPSGEFLSNGSWLFSTDATGLSIWDVSGGLLAGQVPGFRPLRMHPSSHELIEIVPQGLKVWSSSMPEG